MIINNLSDKNYTTYLNMNNKKKTCENNKNKSYHENNV